MYRHAREGLAAAVLAMTVMAGVGAMAEEFPSKPVTIIEPWAPGSAADTVMRLLAEMSSEKLGQPVVVQNLEGGGGTRALLELHRSEPDGHTISNSWVANQIMAPLFNAEVGYGPYDFEPINLVWVNPFTLVVPAEHPAQDLAEFVDWAKSQDRNLRVGVCAAVGIPRVVMQRFLEVAEIANYTPVPYQDCETENIKGMFDGTLDFATGALAVEKIYGDQVRTLAIFLDERSPIAEHIPTAAEFGFDLAWGAAAAGWSGLVAPKGTPEDRLEKLRTVFGEVINSDEFKSRMRDGGNTVQYLGAEQFEALWSISNERLGPAVKALQN